MNKILPADCLLAEFVNNGKYLYLIYGSFFDNEHYQKHRMWNIKKALGGNHGG
jgi:hypothetical protein